MNVQLIINLEILIKYYIITKDHFRRIAYEKAVKVIHNLDFEIEDVKQVKKIKGLGKSIIDKIQEFLITGRIKKVDEAKHLIYPGKTEKEVAIDEFLNIWGVGKEKANVLWDKGYRNIKDIQRDGPSILNRQQLIGLKYYVDLQKKIPRLSITIIQVIIRFILDKEFGKNTYKLVVAGSYLRKKLFSGDIDILITSNHFNLQKMVNILKKWNVITDILSMGQEKFMGIGNCPKGNDPYFRLDIEFLPENEFVFGLLYFTGSKDFTKKIRWYAKKLGYTLNQHGLFNNSNGEYTPANTEADIFKILGLKYVYPKNRI